MAYRTGSLIVLVMLIATHALFAAEPRGKKSNAGGARPPHQGAKHEPPGGEWSEPQHHSGQQPHAAGNKANQSPARAAAAGTAAENRTIPKATGAQGAAAGAAAANRNAPKATGAQGAAAGAAAANRNSPKYSGAQGAAAGAAVANRNAPGYSGAEGAVAGADAVRRNYTNPNLYSAAWYGSHPTVWAPTAFVSGSARTISSWPAVAGFYGSATTPISYGYGSNVVAQQGNVFVNGQNVGTTAEFSRQSAELAHAGADAEANAVDEWLPLGVFAMVRHEEEKPNLILQMAINKQGIIRGNYTDEAKQKTLPIHGSADPKTQRAAWMVGDNKTTIMEAGLSNMASGEVPALTHKGGKTDHWLLVSLPEQPNSP